MSMSMPMPIRSTLLGSDCNHWEATKPTSKLIYFVPGNPGLINYYDYFLTSLFESLDSSVDIYAVGHHGHSLIHTSTIPYSIKDQISHQEACLESILKNREYTDVTLIGHSVGVYIALKMVPSQYISRIFGLFPTIAHIESTPNGRLLAWWLFKNPTIFFFSYLADILGFLFPSIIFRSLISIITNQPNSMAEITTGLVSNGDLVRSALFMAQTEMTDIRELDKEVLIHGPRWSLTKSGNQEMKPTRIELYYGLIDQWVPLERCEEVEKLIKSHPESVTRVHRCEKAMPHAFCLKHSHIMADIVIKWLFDN